MAGPAIAYSGRGIAMTETVSGVTTRLADTGELLSSGGNLDASALSGSTAGASGEALHSSTIGQGDRTRSEASVTQIVLAVGPHQLAADFAMSRTRAVKHGSSITLTGTTHVDSLVLDGLPVLVTGQPNQAIPLPDGLLVINEQSTSTSGGVQSISVNALHMTVGGADVILGTSKAGVSTGSNSCSSSADSTTGGGWFGAGGGAKRTFGFVGGLRANGTPHGHLVFVDHQDDERVRGTITDYARAGQTATMDGRGEMNGQPATFRLTVSDMGEPGTSDTFDLNIITPVPQSENGILLGGNIQTHPVCG